MKYLLLFCVLLAFLLSFQTDYIVQQDDGNLQLFWTGASHRAVRFSTSNPCTLKMVYWGRYTKRSEIDTFFVWSDNGHQIGTLLYSDTHLVNTNRVPLLVSDTVLGDVIVNGLFWVGIGCRTSSVSSEQSYFISDTIGRGTSFWDSNGVWIQQNVGDYIIRAKITGPIGTVTRNYEVSGQYTPASIKPYYIVTEGNSGGYITFMLDQSTNIKVILYDITGRVLGNIFNGNSNESFSCYLNLENYPQGIYYIRILINNSPYLEKCYNIK